MAKTPTSGDLYYRVGFEARLSENPDSPIDYGNTEFTWTDLRYERPGRASFVTRVLVDSEGRILSETFRF